MGFLLGEVVIKFVLEQEHNRVELLVKLFFMNTMIYLIKYLELIVLVTKLFSLFNRAASKEELQYYTDLRKTKVRMVYLKVYLYILF